MPTLTSNRVSDSETICVWMLPQASNFLNNSTEMHQQRINRTKSSDGRSLTFPASLVAEVKNRPIVAEERYGLKKSTIESHELTSRCDRDGIQALCEFLLVKYAKPSSTMSLRICVDGYSGWEANERPTR